MTPYYTVDRLTATRLQEHTQQQWRTAKHLCASHSLDRYVRTHALVFITSCSVGDQMTSPLFSLTLILTSSFCISMIVYPHFFYAHPTFSPSFFHLPLYPSFCSPLSLLHSLLTSPSHPPPSPSFPCHLPFSPYHSPSFPSTRSPLLQRGLPQQVSLWVRTY